MATKRRCCIRLSCFSSHDRTAAESGLSSQTLVSGSSSQTLPESSQCAGALVSGSSDVPMKSPIPGSLNVRVKSMKKNVDVNPNISGALQCDKASSSSTASNFLNSIRDEVIAEKDEVNLDLDKLIEDISGLLKLREEQKPLHKKQWSSRKWTWPGGIDLTYLKEILSSAKDFASDLKEYISGPVKTILQGVATASIATAGLLVVAYALETFDNISSNNEKCWQLLKEMGYVASVVKRLEKGSKIMEEATLLIVEGAIMCCGQMDSSPWKSFLSASKNKEDLSDIRQKLNVMYLQINMEIGFRVLNAIENKGKSPLSKGYPTHAVGIDESIGKVLDLLECESNQNALIVILHGFGGMGKSTLADAVFSRVGGCKYSKVRLFEDINSTPVIVNLQKQILEDLLGPGQNIPNFRTHEDGQRELAAVLEKVDAFIYIDNVLKGEALKKLLPPYINTAKKVRFLLTARDENVKIACPCSGTEPKIKIYKMKGIEDPEAMLILKKEIKEGLKDTELNDIIRLCGGIPLMLTIAAPFIGRAPDKKKAYSTLKQDEGKWKKEGFNEMSCAFAYDALPDECKDPFQDICSYFNKWDWDTVENIVGTDELEKLESRALVTKDTITGVANVHDLILELASHMSKKESKGKEVRLRFASASKLKAFLEKEKEGAEGIRGIWLSTDGKDELKISAAALDLIHKSLRVLHLECPTNVDGDDCMRKFEELVFFKAKITRLPFDVSKSKQLRYLCYEPKDLKDMELSKMPSSLRHLELDGKLQSRAFQISSTDLRKLEYLRTLRLANFSMLKNLPAELGDQVKRLQELSLSSCSSIEKLPDSISNLESLRILKMISCTSLTELPADIGSLSSSLQELNMHRCSSLKALPDSVENLSSLKFLILGHCEDHLRNLPIGLGNLTSLVQLDIGCCYQLKSIHESIGELKLLRILQVSWCSSLKELPDGLCSLSLITNLAFIWCKHLEKLPDQFGQLASLRMLDFECCQQLQKLPEGFGRLKNLEGLILRGCSNLRELCNDFHGLSSLQNLDLGGCERLEKLPEYFNCLTSLQHLCLSSCHKLEGKWMDHMVEMTRLEFVHIKESQHLVNRWEEIQRDGDGSWSFTVISGKYPALSDSKKENIEINLLAEFDRLLTNARGERLHMSDFPSNTLILVICDLWPLTNKFPWTLIEETVNEMQMKIIYIGPYFDGLPMKDSIYGIHLLHAGANEVLEKVRLTLDGAGKDGFPWYLQMHTKKVGDEKSDIYCPSWSFLKESELEEFVVGNCKRYLQLNKLVRTDQESNAELLRELFAPEGDATIPIFEKNDPSQQDRMVTTTCGVGHLKGKTILLELRPAELCYDIRLQSLKEMYDVVQKKKLPLEIISIPIADRGDVHGAFEVYKQFSREVPWFVLQNSRRRMTRSVKFFLAKQCGWEESDEYEKWYPTINWIIEPNGRIILYRPSMSFKDRGEIVKFIFNHLESDSYQVRWGVKASPIMHEKIEELRKEEWEQFKSISTLEFLFKHLESVSNKVKKLMVQGKLICLCNRIDEEVLYSMWNAMEQWRDHIHIIHTGHQKVSSSLYLTKDICKDYYYPSENTAKMEGISLLNLSSQEIVRFSMRLHHLENEFNEMDQSDQQLCELKSLLLLYLPNEDEDSGYDVVMHRSMIFVDKGGKVIAALRGDVIESIFQHPNKYRAQQFLKSMMRDHPSISDSLILNMQIGSSAAFEQENVDAYFDSLREYLTDLLEVEIYQRSKFNKEGKEWSRPNVTWPTSRNFCMLKNFLSDGTNADWVKDAISRHPHENKRKTVIESLLDGIEEANWAVAALLAVAHLLDRFETVSAHFRDDEMQALFVLEGMFRLGEYIKQVNEKGGLWRRMKRATTAWILASSIQFCTLIDPSKFAWFESKMYVYMLRHIEEELIEESDRMASAIAEGLDESGSRLEQMCADMESHLEQMWAEHCPESEDESGTEYPLASDDEAGASSEEETGVSSAKACSSVTIGEDE